MTLPVNIFNTVIDSENDDKITYRASCCNKADINKWLKKYGETTHTNWIVKYNLKDPEKMIMHTTWACQHAIKNKLSLKYRNTNCLAKIDVKIKKVNKGTKKNDPYLKLEVPLCAVITVEKKHSGNLLHCSEAFKYLRMTKETEERFLNFFREGNSPAEAMELNSSIVEELDFDNMAQNLADSSINPTSNMVYYLHKKWRKEEFGTIDPVQKTIEKIPVYKEKGTHVAVREEEDIWSAIVVTPVMKRNQSLLHSSHTAFVDTSASCDVTQCNVTVISTATKAGAVPIGIILHKAQTTKNYQQGFQLFRDECPLAFGGNEEPESFMIDDSSAERAALEAVWPKARRLMCHFHITQAEWRWLMSNVKKEDRIALMRAFQAVLYADTEEKFNEAEKILREKGKDYPKFIRRFELLLKRKLEWCIVDRLDLITRNHNTNNFSEATIRVLKDIILRRTKAFNLVALIDFCVLVWDPYFVRRLLKVANTRCNANDIFYDRLCNRNGDIGTENIKKIDDILFEIPSFTKQNVIYNVNIEVGHCSCMSGRTGGFCKHQAIIHKIYNIQLPNAPPVNGNDLFGLAQLALGEKVGDQSFYRRLRDVASSPSRAIDTTENSDSLTQNIESMEVREVEHEHLTVQNNEIQQNLIEEASVEFNRILELVKNHDNTNKLLGGLICNFKKIKNPNTAIMSLLSLKTNINSTKKGRKIKVQPTAISRRRHGLSRGSRPVPRGRPSKEEIQHRSVKKLPEILAKPFRKMLEVQRNINGY